VGWGWNRVGVEKGGEGVKSPLVEREGPIAGDAELSTKGRTTVKRKVAGSDVIS
jgi:hypothetical protein